MSAQWPDADADHPGDDLLRRRLAAAPGPAPLGANAVEQVAHRVERRAARRRAARSGGALVAGFALLGGGLLVAGLGRQGGVSNAGVAASGPSLSVSRSASVDVDASARAAGGSAASAAEGAGSVCPADFPAPPGGPASPASPTGTASPGRLAPHGAVAAALICQVGAGAAGAPPPGAGRRVPVEESWLIRLRALTAEPPVGANPSAGAGCPGRLPSGADGGYLVRLDLVDGATSWLRVPGDPCGRLTNGLLSAPQDPVLVAAVRHSAETGVPLRG